MAQPLGTAPNLYIGTAGWSIPGGLAGAFGTGPSHLARYATRLPAVEINSSFYRPHRPATYARWAASVPTGFQFAVKVPKAITHAQRLVDAGPLLDAFLAESGALGAACGPLLVQLPPRLAFDETIAGAFFAALRDRYRGPVVCEPRHPSWFTDAGEHLLVAHQVARVAADPAVVPAAAEPGGWEGLVYYRLHGSPRIYYSAYEPPLLAALATRLQAATRSGPAWCIFDNTAEGAAAANALDLLARLAP
ncbi:MAG TPA: DUF72 domain-containing protein [Chloroflexia bacterium]|nr:DUF72 domain-containing protein [Chloroflexia bacterium]